MKKQALLIGLLSLFIVGCNQQNISSNSEQSTNQGKALKKLYILSINDLHGHIMKDEKGRNGLSSLSYKIEEIRNREGSLDDVVLIANGDMFQGQAISNLVYGRSVINVMNEMDFDMMGIGNHEFDWGIEKILTYWDENEANGEANFPLVNSNVYQKSKNALMEQTVPYVIVQKENLKIGICSAIDPEQESSILKTRLDDYTFKETKTSIAKTAEILRRDEHCDIVIASIHDGAASSSNAVTNNNNAIAGLKDNQFVDALINGHTHYRNKGTISRGSDVAPLPVVQAGSSGQALGIITLTLNANKKVTKAEANWEYTDTNYNKDIEALVQNEYNTLKNQIEEVYGTGGETISSESDLYAWAGSCMQKATDADFAYSNQGGIRGTGNIKSNQKITVENLYDINPFDNEILVTNKLGKDIKDLVSYESNYYTFKDGLNYETLDENKTYKVAVIDYVGFKDYFKLGTDYTNTKLIYRDLMRDDIKARTAAGKKFMPKSEPKSILTNLLAS